MKRRGWRVALTVATIGLALVAGLVALNWPVVRDHAEAWWFQATTDTKTFFPEVQRTAFDGYHRWSIEYFFCVLAKVSGCAVICNSVDLERFASAPFEETMKSGKWSTEGALVALRATGYRVLEQRFPRRAYVVTAFHPPIDRPLGANEYLNYSGPDPLDDFADK